MFKIPKGSDFEYDSLPLKPLDDYRLGPGDRLSFVFGPNKGERIVFNQSGVTEIVEGNLMNAQNTRNRVDYLIRQDGTIELPLVGIIQAKNLTIIEFEDTLTNRLSRDFIDPFVQIRVTNQRVIVFPGRGLAQVVYLTNANTSLLEVLAMAGGILEEGRANSIRIMRRTDIGKREVYKVDLSTINGINVADMIVQGNDYIYVDYKPRIASSVFREVGPWLTLATTTATLIALILR
ncbi:MAG: hypothetical protein RL264_3084 [Bacteroidota bacterium]